MLGGLALALATQAGSIMRLAFGGERTGVAAEASRGHLSGTPWPLKAGLDVVLLAGAALSFALTARNGFQVVLAPEGIPQTQVNYPALADPNWRGQVWPPRLAHHLVGHGEADGPVVVQPRRWRSRA
ncbi:hypothetical protein NOCA2150034 [metagenome]|uniref:Uncharacterized protein n=1 Tax=metagenome TaxID=256318 RepID=A0A2P2C0R2_9ZZZZ